MILTVDENKKKIILNDLVLLEEKRRELEYLEYLYKTPNMELGYLEYGNTLLSNQKLQSIINRMNHDDKIMVYDEYIWGKNGINGIYPIKTYISKARNTLNLIRQILGERGNESFSLASFFMVTTNEILESGILTHPFDLSVTLQKLKYILQAKELALPMLRDYYLDFYLFVTLLDYVKVEKEESSSDRLYSMCYKEALENTQIMDLALEFKRIRKK